uniref:Ig-like domain-containing protein n=1 Tax=Mesocestoides corti TaxID=53468 RepID=A0A5K3F5V7_MESCO
LCIPTCCKNFLLIFNVTPVSFNVISHLICCSSSLSQILSPVVAFYMFVMSPQTPNDWSIRKMENEKFQLETHLPGTYSTITTNLGNASLADGSCSTESLTCSYVTESGGKTKVTLSGTMTPGLMWATFTASANDLEPITVFFFNNKTWTNIDHNIIQPQFSLPLVISAKGKKFVTFSCVASIYTRASVKLYTGLNPKLYYSKNFQGVMLDEVKNHSQIVNFEDKSLLVFHKFTLTVRQDQPVDYYTCQIGKMSLTHQITW